MPSTPSPPDAALLARLPTIFVDRSLGAIQVPQFLRDAGLSIVTMREHYGEARAQAVKDEEWITLTASQGWLGFSKDDAVRRNVVERQTVLATGARLFCVPTANIAASNVADRFIANLTAIALAAALPGPFIYSVYSSRITRLVPAPDQQ